MASPAIAQVHRAAVNQANALHSTGPRTEIVKQPSSLNALTQGLTLNRIPLLEADLLARATPTEEPGIAFDIVDAHPALATPGTHGQRPASSKRRSTSSARSRPSAASASAATSETTPPASNSITSKGFPFDPAENGFVFYKCEIDTLPQREMRQNESRYLEHALLDPTRFQRPKAKTYPVRPVPAHYLVKESKSEC